MKRKTAIVGSLLPAVLGFAVSGASAAWVAIDNLDGYVAGSAIGGQGSWSASGASVSVANDPAGGTNKVLSVTGANQYARNNAAGIAIADNTTGTLFYQIRYATTTGLDIGHGLSDNTGTNFQAFEAQLGSVSTNLVARDSGVTQTPVTGLAANIWYSIWIIANNATDTMQFYIQGGSFGTPTLFDGGLDPYGFRNGTTASLSSFFILTGSPSNSATLYVDNIYADTSGSNATNPVPEPASMALGLVAAALVGRRPRRSARA